MHALRPPALDEVGLLGALDQQAQRFRLGSEGLDVTLRSSTEVVLSRTPGLPEALEVVVSDDGCGIDPAAPAGVGLVSLHERAAELGGAVSVVCPPAGGTVVTGVLPLGRCIPAQPTGAEALEVSA